MINKAEATPRIPAKKSSFRRIIEAILASLFECVMLHIVSISHACRH